jgi:hypothetical protein
VARRIERTVDDGPLVVVELLPGSAQGSTFGSFAPPAVVELRAPGEVTALRVVERARQLRHTYLAQIGAHRGFNPRHHAVHHRLGMGAGDVVVALRASPVERHWTAEGFDLAADVTDSAFDSVEHEHRFAARLHLAWSWPDLPVWLAIGELTPSRCTLRLMLRSRHRVRYPARYFHAAHAALTALERELAPAS